MYRAISDDIVPHQEQITYADEEKPAEEPVSQAPPIPLTIRAIPQGVEHGDFLRELGYDLFIECELLQNELDMIAIWADTAISDLRIILLIPRYDANYDGQWQIVRRYSHTWTRDTIELSPNEPYIFSWRTEQGITESGLDGVAFTDEDGHERFFVLRYGDGVPYLEELEDWPHTYNSPRITITRPSQEIELIAAWIADWQPEDERDDQAAIDNFLQQFDTYTEFENPTAISESWVVFGTNTDLRDFTFFRLGHNCDMFVDGELRPFHVGTVLGSQEVLPADTPVVVPWHPSGTWPHFGISFLDETGQRRNFSLNSNEGSGFPPMFISEFYDRVYCSYCVRRTLAP